MIARHEYAHDLVAREIRSLESIIVQQEEHISGIKSDLDSAEEFLHRKQVELAALRATVADFIATGEAAQDASMQVQGRDWRHGTQRYG